MGAVGIARTFAYGGYVRRPIHDPDDPPVLHETAESYFTTLGTTINHFHEKLLLLPGRLTTATGQRLGKERHDFMVKFLEQFHCEWDGPGAGEL